MKLKDETIGSPRDLHTVLIFVSANVKIVIPEVRQSLLQARKLAP